MASNKLDLSLLGFVSEKEINGHIYTLYHQETGDKVKGFSHTFFLVRDGNPTDFKKAPSITTTIPDAPGKPGSHQVDIPSWKEPHKMWGGQ